MKKQLNYLLVMAGLLLFLGGCQKQDLTGKDSGTTTAALKKSGETLSDKQDEKANTFYGPQVHIGDGKVRSWIRITHSGIPEEIGVEMTQGSLMELPVDDHVSLVLPLHQKAKEVTPFDHVYFNWNPEGHEPIPFFGVPHFDFHFEMTSVAEREMIPAYSPASDAMFNNYPPAGYIPVDYGTGPGGAAAEIAMGKHWLPPPPTFLPFSKVMIYGTYNGHVTFVEPMITRAYLMSQASSSQPYSQPTLFEHTGKYYPTTMNISYADGKHYVSLGGFVKR